ncbi:hypothetical protein LCGC14_2114340 [marine sediment metagenome]|uniref:Uncharacterized protein n=1 Tax=marine sediment metagenome TaxID=412755 RepID=A0A0F9E660_9ZZZZ
MKMKYLSRREVWEKKREKHKGGRKIRGLPLKRKCKRPKRTMFSMREVGSGYASMNWDNILLGRR